MSETSFWFRKGSDLVRSKNSSEPEIANATNYPYVTVINQGDTETMFLESRGIYVDRPFEYIEHSKGNNKEYPLNVHVEYLTSDVTEEVPAKYLPGYDGGKSAVRETLSIESSAHKTGAS